MTPLRRAKRSWLRLLDATENALARWQGKGTGASTAEAEARLVATLFDRSSVRLCIDVGGNKGRYAAAAAELFPGATIHVFEPSRVNIEEMTERFRPQPRVHLHPYALSDKTGEAILYSNKPGSGLASLRKRRIEHYGIRLDIEEQVRTLRFEDFWNDTLGRSPIDIVKLDIEGFEIAALRGFGEAVRSIHAIQFEFGGCNIDTRTYFRDFWHFFRPRGFRLYRMTPVGLFEIERYDERLENFTTSNYVAVSKRPPGAASSNPRP